MSGTIGINIGASEGGVKSVKDSIMEILNARVDNATMQAALEVLKTSCNVNNTSINHCNISLADPALKEMADKFNAANEKRKGAKR